VHQESYSVESLASNLHQLTFAIDCNRGTEAARYPVKLLASLMATFGNPASFVATQANVDTTVAFGTAQPASSRPAARNGGG
jgi:hypothetical protein